MLLIESQIISKKKKQMISQILLHKSYKLMCYQLQTKERKVI